MSARDTRFDELDRLIAAEPSEEPRAVVNPAPQRQRSALPQSATQRREGNPMPDAQDGEMKLFLCDSIKHRFKDILT